MRNINPLESAPNWDEAQKIASQILESVNLDWKKYVKGILI